MKKLSRIVIFLITHCCCYNVTLAQDAVSIDMVYSSGGQIKSAVTGEHYGDMDGSPYLYDTWLSGSAKLNDGKTYTDLLLKYDVLSNQLLFKYNSKDTPMAFGIQPVAFNLKVLDTATQKFRSMYFSNGFVPMDGADDKTFYWVMSQGSVKLLKLVKKKIVVNTEMNTTISKQTVEESTTYYIARENTPVKIKNNKKVLLTVLNDQIDQLQKYITEHQLDIKKDDDLKQLVDYYNDIKKS